MSGTRTYLLFLFLCWNFLVLSQHKNPYKLYSNNLSSKENKTLAFSKDSIQLKQRLTAIRLSHQKKGFVLANVDSLSIDSFKNVRISYYKGPQLKQMKINASPSDAKILQRWSGIREAMLTRQSLSPTEVESLFKKLLGTYTNNGYAFAKVKLDVTKMDSTSIEADLVVEAGPQLFWNTLHLKGDSTLPKKLIANTIQFKKGEPFSEARFQNISRKIMALNLYEELRPANLLFTEKGVDLYVYLSPKKLSSVNGIIGLQPNTITGKMQFTGDINLKLNNVLKRGEYLGLNWSSLQAQTQQLKTALKYPYLFNTPFGVEGSFNLYKRDTTFLELETNVGVSYNLSGNFYIKAYYENFTSNILAGGSTSSLNYGNTKTNLYGLAVNFNNYDYVPLPTKGFGVIASFSTGIRKSSPIQDTLTSKNTVYKGDLTVQWYIQLAKRHVVRLANATQLYQAPTFYTNEAYRFGGLQSQRGFNEQFLLATARSTASIEYRFMLERTSYLFAFFDQSWYENNTSAYYKDYPMGFGAGFTFGTSIGMFSLSFAVGKTSEEEIKIRNGKIHFGYIALF